MSKPRILIISTPPSIGGGEIYLSSIVEGLKQLDFRVLTSSHQLKKFCIKKNIPTTNYYFSQKFYSNKHIILFIVLLPIYWAQLVINLLRWRPDLIHIQSNEERLSAVFPAKLLNIPVAWTAHGQLDLTGSSIYKSFFRYAATTVSFVACITEYVRDSMIKAGVPPSKCHIIFNGIDVNYYGSCVNDTTGAVGYLGRFEEIKNPKLFIEMAAKLMIDMPEIKFKMAGSGTQLEDCKILAQKLGVADKVSFLGYISNTKSFFESCSILVIPSNDEGMGIAAAEAMAAGVPVVATSVGGLKEVIHDGITGILVPPQDSRQLADGVSTLLKDRIVYSSISNSAKQYAKENLSLVDMLNKTSRLYLDNMAQRHSK